MSVLSDILTSKSARQSQPFILFQSHTAQSSLPILRAFLGNLNNGLTLLFSFLYPPATLVTSSSRHNASLQVYNRLAKVPIYDDEPSDARKDILSAIHAASPGSLNVVIDSLDTLASDIGSTSQTYQFLCELLAQIRARADPSHLVLHLLSPSELSALLIQPTFSTSLTHIIAYPPVLLSHLATTYFVYPPPVSSPDRFWGVFLPLSRRSYEIDRLVFGTRRRESRSDGAHDIVVEILTRDGGGGRLVRGRAVERVLEGFSDGGARRLVDLASLKNLWADNVTEKAASDPTQNLTFNLNLTSSQQQSRAVVPLPYAHQGTENPTQNPPFVIHYDPDSADDLDEDDPDEDLDI